MKILKKNNLNLQYLIRKILFKITKNKRMKSRLTRTLENQQLGKKLNIEISNGTTYIGACILAGAMAISRAIVNKELQDEEILSCIAASIYDGNALSKSEFLEKSNKMKG